MDPAEYETGKIYFSCGYLLRFRPVPVFNPVVFIGKNIYGRSDEGDLYFFQEPEAYFREELNFERLQNQLEGESDEDGDGIFFVKAEHVGDFATDVNGLREFVEKLSSEANARDVLGGVR